MELLSTHQVPNIIEVLFTIIGLFFFPFHLGSVYIADSYNHRIRKVTVSTGIIKTIAGTGTSSYSGDNGQATAATVNYPVGVALDSTGFKFLSQFIFFSLQLFSFIFIGNVYIADYYNHCVRKVTVSTGIIKTIAGTGTSSYSGDNGQATSAALYRVTYVALDSSGIIFYSQSCAIVNNKLPT